LNRKNIEIVDYYSNILKLTIQNIKGIKNESDKTVENGIDKYSYPLLKRNPINVAARNLRNRICVREH
jgi:hypothetical protein